MADISNMFVKQILLEINDACTLDFSRSEFSFVQYRPMKLLCCRVGYYC